MAARAAGAAGVVLVLFLGLPVAALVVRSAVDGSLAVALGTRAVLDALALSLTTTALSLAVTVLLGTPLAYLLARRRFPGKAIVEAAVDLPIVLPPSVAGIALLLVLGRRGLAGAALDTVGISIPFTTVAVVLAQIFVAAPLFVRSARGAFAAVDQDLEDAARVDGASEAVVVREVTVPIAAAALAAGAVLTWARALGEFGATIMFAGNVQGRTQTLPLLVYSAFQSSLDASVAAASILAIAAFAFLVAVRALGHRAGADGRSLA